MIFLIIQFEFHEFNCTLKDHYDEFHEFICTLKDHYDEFHEFNCTLKDYMTKKKKVSFVNKNEI